MASITNIEYSDKMYKNIKDMENNIWLNSSSVTVILGQKAAQQKDRHHYCSPTVLRKCLPHWLI
jgi:hypothetical protein